jgi:hypothetical protein
MRTMMCAITVLLIGVGIAHAQHQYPTPDVPTSEPAAVPAAVAAEPRDTLERYARDTWASFVAMTDEATGLPADRLHLDGTRSVQTSITNIGAYLWSTLVAEALGFVGHDEAVARLDRTLHTLETMDRHVPSGQFFNWHDHTTGETLTVWPPSGEPLTPILSSVDNGWLATALHRRSTLRPHEFWLLLSAPRQPDPVLLRAEHGRGPVLL